MQRRNRARERARVHEHGAGVRQFQLDGAGSRMAPTEAFPLEQAVHVDTARNDHGDGEHGHGNEDADDVEQVCHDPARRGSTAPASPGEPAQDWADTPSGAGAASAAGVVRSTHMSAASRTSRALRAR
jgi:hypothetical protein